MLANSPIAAVLPCTDLEQARRFYGRTLGLPEIKLPFPESDSDMSMADGVVLYHCGAGTMLLVYARETPTQADHTAAGWMVEDFDTVVNDLMDRGVTFETYTNMPGASWDERGVATDPNGFRGAWFRDPEGNILSISEWPAQD